MSKPDHLPNDDNRQTRPLSSDKEFQPAPQRRPHILNNQIPRAIRFISTDMEEVSTVEISSMMVVGRRNSMKDMDVVVDLSGYDAHKMGVSRYHSMILTLDNRVTIKDLNSLNGTRLNNLDLEPSQEYLLEHGDTVTFGKLSFLIAFVY